MMFKTTNIVREEEQKLRMKKKKKKKKRKSTWHETKPRRCNNKIEEQKNKG